MLDRCGVDAGAVQPLRYPVRIAPLDALAGLHEEGRNRFPIWETLGNVGRSADAGELHVELASDNLGELHILALCLRAVR